MSEDDSSGAAKETKTFNFQEVKKLLVFIKVICFVLCLYGFFHQALQFLDFFWTYPTVIENKIEKIDEFMAPAFKYCYIKKITRSKFCKTYPDFCYKLEKDNPRCEIFPTYCQENIEIPDWGKFMYNTNGVKKVKMTDLYSDVNDSIDHSLVHTPWSEVNKELEGPYYYAPWWSANAFPCFTLHSRVDSIKDTVKVKLSLTLAIADSSNRHYAGIILFALDRRIFLDPKYFEGVAVQLHSPFDNTLPDMNTILKPGRKYKMEIKLKQLNLLPYPYETDCINYTLLWENNNRTGPRSRRMCLELCAINHELACFNCTNIWNMYPTSGLKCFIDIRKQIYSEQWCSRAIIKSYKECVSQCKWDCLLVKYEYSIKETVNDPWDFRQYYKDDIEIDVYMDPTILITHHRPRYQYVELFSNLGGYLGIWLGISLFTLSDVVKIIFRLMKFCFMCRPRYTEEDK